MARRTTGRIAVSCWVGVLALAALACGHRTPPGAVGANDEISVLTNAPRTGPAVSALSHVYAYPVQTGPTRYKGSDPAFRLDFPPFRRFRTYQWVKNQIFAVDMSRDDDLAHAVPGYLGDAGKDRLQRKEPFHFLARDRWATGQTSLFAVAWSEAGLRALFTGPDSTDLRREYAQAVVDGLTKTMYDTGEELDLEREVSARYGWTLRLLNGFFAAQDTARGNFVKFNAADPVRLVLVHWVDGELPLAPAPWDSVLGRVLTVYNDGDFVMDEFTRVFPAVFQGEPALKWEGIWQNEKYVIGGPFRAFAFHRDGRSYLLVGQVFAPGQDKVPMLRQVEAMLTTFRLVR